MPYADVSAFLVALRKVPGIGARALELTVLLALRTGETINARWSEIDLEAGLWVVPGERMKGGREHRVPLVGRALELLTEEHEARCGSDLVFPGRKPGKPISNMSMEMVMRRMGYGDRVNSKGEMLKGDKPDYTVHGMRSTFADWARDLTDHPEEVIEAALAHVFGSAVRRAYRRGDAMDKRRALMTDWDRWCLGAPAAANDEPAEISPDERAGGEASAAM